MRLVSQLPEIATMEKFSSQILKEFCLSQLLAEEEDAVQREAMAVKEEMEEQEEEAQMELLGAMQQVQDQTEVNITQHHCHVSFIVFFVSGNGG